VTLATAMEDHDGRRLRVARLGRGVPVVFLHGYPDNLQIWSNVMPRIGEAFQATAFDWPGMGWSDPWPGGTTPDHMADRLRALLDVWGHERAVLVGMDMGGQPALSLAARRPERVAALVVSNSLVLPDEATSWEIRVLRRLQWNRALLEHVPRLVFERAVHTSLPSGVRLPADLRDDLWTAFRRPEVRRFVARLCAGYQGTLGRLPALYRHIACPTLVLWGAEDRHFPRGQGDALKERIPGARLRVIAGGGHWMAWHAAEEVASEVRAFLTEAQLG
jgi:pimeloyl-ACP methyl ester carboxylesterase